MPKFSLDISKSLIFCIVFLAMAGLVALGKIPADKLEYLLFVLVPSPIRDEAPTPKVQ